MLRVCGVLCLCLGLSLAGLSINPDKKTVVESQRDTVLSCFTHGLQRGDDPNLQWYAGTELMTPDGGDRQVELASNKLYILLSIYRFRPEFDANYTCQAMINGTLIRKSVEVLVLEVKFHGVDDFQSGIIGDDTTIGCQFTAARKPWVLVWKHNTTKVNYGVRFQLAGTDLKISNFMWQDVGRYECSVNLTEYNYVRFELIKMIGYARPAIEWHTENRTWVVGTKASFSCLVTGTPYPQIHFYQGANTVDLHNTTRMSIIPNGTVRFDPIQHTDKGTYRCKATNAHGTAEAQVYVDVTDKLPVPGLPNVSVFDLSSDTVNLTITPQQDSFAHYVKLYRVEFDGKSLEFGVNDRVVLTNLQPDTVYVFMVSAKNLAGQGPSRDVTHITKARGTGRTTLPISTNDRAPSPPDPVQITSPPTSIYDDQYQVEWVVGYEGGSDIHAHRIRYVQVAVDTQGNVKETVNAWVQRIRKGSGTSYWLQELVPGSYYQVEIQLMNDLGWSEPNANFVFATAPEDSVQRDTNTRTVPSIEQNNIVTTPSSALANAASSFLVLSALLISI